MESLQQTFKGLGSWLDQSLSIKLLFIGILILLLLIPSSWVNSLIYERQARQQQVVKEIGQQWSGEQVIGGPVIVIPYKTMIRTVADNKEKFEEVTEQVYLLPEVLQVSGQTQTELLHRGIFDAVVYQAKLKVTGNFAELDYRKLDVDPSSLLWDKARLVVGLGDLKGLTNSPKFTIGGNTFETETDFGATNVFDQNLVVAPGLEKLRSTAVPFSFELDLRGSESLHFMHLGKNSSITVQGNWNAPSFDGGFLPEKREVSNSGFTASWKIPYYTRQLPQQWKAPASVIRPVLEETDTDPDTYTAVAPKPAVTAKDGERADSFGIRFLQPVDHYQKTVRTAKYAILIILLTFVSLFFTEVITKKRIHIMQYLLIGSAMIVYYCLLMSFTELLGFNTAYLIASVATIGLVSAFIASLLKNRKTAGLFAGILSVFYLFIFVIIQLQDQALLFGSIGLFIIVALLMYFSGKINWQRSQD